MDHVYLLNKSGMLLGHWNRHTLIPQDARPNTRHEGITSRVIALNGGDAELRIETKIGPAVAPRVEALACAADGGFLIVAIAHALVWITPSGQISHSICLAMDDPELPGYSGTIRDVHISRGGDTIVAHVHQRGFVFVKSGKPMATTPFGPVEGWSYEDRYDVLAVKALGEDRVVLYGLDGYDLARLKVSPDVKTILFSECGSVLIAVGSDMEMFRLSWSAEEST